MSAFVSMVHAAGCDLFTDGAVWSSIDQTLIDVRSKVTVSKSGQVAVTAIGDADFGEIIRAEICAVADRVGSAALMDGLQDYAEELRGRFGVIDGARGTDFLVAACVPGRGGIHRRLRTYAQGHDCSYEVVDPGGTVCWSGAVIYGAELGPLGLLRWPGEGDDAYVRRLGVGVLSAMRFRPGCSREGGPRDIWVVGGKIDMTTLSATGAKTETVMTWPDVIGERIDPYRGLPRAERRRMQRVVG